MNSTDTGRISPDAIDSATIVTLNGSPTGTVTGNGLPVTVQASVQLNNYSITLTKIPVKEPGASESETNKRFVTLSLTGTATVTLTKSGGNATLTGTKAALTSKDIKLALNSDKAIKVYSATASVEHDTSENTGVTITIQSIKAEGTISSSDNITQVIVTIQSVDIKITVTPTQVGEAASSEPTEHTISTVKLTLPVPQATKPVRLEVQPEPTVRDKTLEITVQDVGEDAGESGPRVTIVQVSGYGFSPIKDGYCIYSVRDGTTDTATNKKDIWANIGGKCEYVACYYKTGKASALLTLYFRSSGGSPERKYFGTDDAGKDNTEWKTIPSEDEFIDCLKKLAPDGGELTTLPGTPTPQYNRGLQISLRPYDTVHSYI